MKIAVFYNLPSGGARRTVFEQVKRLTRCHQVDIYTIGDSEESYWDGSLHAQFFIRQYHPSHLWDKPFRRFNQLSRAWDIVRLRNLERYLAEEIDSRGYDVILVHPCQYTISPSIIQYLRTPILYYTHDVNRYLYDPVIRRPYRMRNSLQRILDRLDPFSKLYYWILDREDRCGRRVCGRYLTNSYFSRESIFRVYGRSPLVCYHGIDTDLFRVLDVARKYQVLGVGAIVPYKGYDFIIESLSTIEKSIRPPLIIVANSINLNEKAYLEHLARKCQVELCVHSKVTDDFLVTLYNESLLTVYAPVMESFGLVPLESMACGTPVVGISEGGVRETIQNQINGLLVDRDPVLFGKAIISLIKDEDLRRKLGQKGREYVVDQWNWDKAIMQLEAYLDQAVLARTGRNNYGN